MPSDQTTLLSQAIVSFSRHKRSAIVFDIDVSEPDRGRLAVRGRTLAEITPDYRKVEQNRLKLFRRGLPAL
jgi:hypothetical protein